MYERKTDYYECNTYVTLYLDLLSYLMVSIFLLLLFIYLAIINLGAHTNINENNEDFFSPEDRLKVLCF